MNEEQVNECDELYNFDVVGPTVANVVRYRFCLVVGQTGRVIPYAVHSFTCSSFMRHFSSQPVQAAEPENQGLAYASSTRSITTITEQQNARAKVTHWTR